MADTIVKLLYRREFFDFEKMRTGARRITVITNDGKIVGKEYEPGSRKAHTVRAGECSVEAYQAICRRLAACIETADRREEYCDDARETLTIYHKYGRIQTMERGLGNGFVSIGEVMNDFLAEYLPECVG